MAELIEIARLMALGQVLFFGLLMAVKYRSWTGLLVLLNCLGVGSYILMPLIPEPRTFFVLLATSIPAFFWLLSYRFFVGEGRPHWLIWPWWVIYLGLWMSHPTIEGDLGQFMHRFVPQLMKLALVLHVIYLAMVGRRDDLIENRLKLRVPAAIFFGAIVLFVIVVELWLQGPAPMMLEMIWSMMVLVFVTFATVNLLQVRPDFPLFDSVRVSEPVANETRAEENRLVAQIEEAMSKQRFYAQHGVTLSDLASDLAVQEYLLRRTINQQMGYANFNRFLNEYRIKEASERLRQQPDLPVLTIALDVGFKSLSSFNKAFKETHQLTPTAYRQQNEQKS